MQKLVLVMAIICFGADAQSGMPRVVRRALEFLPVPAPNQVQVVVLKNAEGLEPYLAKRGYGPEARKETIRAVKGYAEFTIDHRFPIFINAGTYHYRRIAASFDRGPYPDQAARVLASDLFHEYQHASRGEEELDALTAHVELLLKWQKDGLLTIADPYIRAKCMELESIRSTGANSRQKSHFERGGLR